MGSLLHDLWCHSNEGGGDYLSGGGGGVSNDLDERVGSETRSSGNA